MLTALLRSADARLFAFLRDRPEAIPLRAKKLVAWHYPDARIRKLYWSHLNVHMGEDTYANPGLLVVNTMDPDTRITLGRRVSIAPGVVLVSDSSPNNSPLLLNTPEVRERMVRRAPIVVDDDVWLGAGAIVLPGVCIGRGAVVGAGAVVTRDVPMGAVVAGVPARVVRMLPPLSAAGSA